MNITIYGSGYVGLVTGALLADVGNSVLCVDIDENKVESLKQGQVPIYEPGLEDIVKRNIHAQRLDFTTNIETAVNFSEIQFIAVGTPPDEDGSADLKHVLTVASSIGTHMNERKLVVNKSTVPVGTADKVSARIQECLQQRNVDLEASVISNPEFLKEGAAIDDFMKPDRIIVGTDDDYAKEQMRTLYAPFCRNHDRLIFMGVRSAEMTKYAANAILATKISFMNELANMAEELGADIECVRTGIGSDPRIGYQFIYPGCGYGGSCFPKDVKALAAIADGIGYNAELLRAVEAVNERQKQVLFNKINRYFEGNMDGKTIALWGLAFKPNTDDMREAPSRVLMESLWAAGAKVKAYDPVAMQEARKLYPDQKQLELMGTAQDALEGADALAIVTEWREFRSPDWPRVISALANPAVFDGRNLYDPEMLRAQDLQYFPIGRP